MFVYISEAHATDVWPIGDSAGVSNKKHQSIADRAACATNFIEEYNFSVPTYLDNMQNTLRDELAAWPFRYYLIRYDTTKKAFVFVHIAMPTDAEFDLGVLLDFLNKD